MNPFVVGGFVLGSFIIGYALISMIVSVCRVNDRDGIEEFVKGYESEAWERRDRRCR